MYLPRQRNLKDCSWDAHIANVVWTGKSHVRKMDAILTDSHLDPRSKYFEVCNLINVIVPKREYAEVWEWNKTRKTVGHRTDDSS